MAKAISALAERNVADTKEGYVRSFDVEEVSQRKRELQQRHNQGSLHTPELHHLYL
jgi:hypothetical protein